MPYVDVGDHLATSGRCSADDPLAIGQRTGHELAALFGGL
jgi:hypothetical protein